MSTPQTTYNSPYADQLAEGFGRLRFGRTLEDDFRLHNGQQNLWRMRVGTLMVMSIFVLYGWAEMVTLRNTSITRAMITQLVAVPPLCLLAYLASYHRRLQHHLTPFIIAYVLAIGLGSIGIARMMPVGGYLSHYYAGLLLITMYVYFIPGLLFRSACLGAGLLLIFGIAHGIDIELPTAGFWFVTIILVCANVIGAVGCYLLEYKVRTIYLNTGLIAEMAERDGLTGLYNRRMLDSRLDQVWRQATREKTPLAVMMIDIDNFKMFNDTYGHLVGDECLKGVAGALARVAQRPLDIAARYGGEEFVVVWYNITRAQAEELAKGFRRDLVGQAVRKACVPDGKQVTTSIGVVVGVPGEDSPPKTMLAIADKALYESKAGGRNKITVVDLPTGQTESAEKP